MRRLLAGLLVVAGLGAGLAACGDDDSGSAPSAGDATTTTAMADDGGDGHGHGGASTGTDQPLCAEGDTEVFPPSSVPGVDADPVTVTVTEEEAGDTTVYAFSESVATDLAGLGSYAVTFENQGAEMHEMAVVRLHDGEARTVAQLLEAVAAGESPSTFSTDVAATSACPGEESTVGLSIGQPGRYVMLCLFDVGAEPGLTQAELDALTGPPHAALGMVTEIVVP